MLGLTSASVGRPSFEVDVVCAVFAGAAVALRLFCKIRYKKGLESDDWWVVIALACYYMAVVRVTYGSVKGIGTLDKSVMHRYYKTGEDRVTIMKNTPVEIIDQWPPYLKAIFFALAFISLAEYACKMSILFYCRNIFFITKTYRKASLALMVISTVWVIAVVLCVVLMCRPVSYFWEGNHPDTRSLGECSTGWGLALMVVHGVGGVIDAAILLLPIRIVLTLQMAKETKYAVAGIFALGGFVVLTNVVRIKKENGAFSGPGESWFHTEIWTSIHLMTAILCASLPIYKQLGAPISAAVASLCTRCRRCSPFAQLSDREPAIQLESTNGSTTKEGNTGTTTPQERERDRDLELGSVRAHISGDMR